jgi:GTPase
MSFVDEVTIHARAGKGGDGVVRWLHLKGKEFAGPAGGNGGKGGNVCFQAIRDIAALQRYRYEKDFKAPPGGSGGNQSMHGKDGDDLILPVPVGSVVMNKATGETFELLTDNDIVTVLKGGRGGLGNEHFKGSTNINPEESTPGVPGESADIYIELKLVVDAGFVGLPNAGKSSLLNTLTRARAKVADYQFTTLEPNLGDFYGYILADIPGLIEGAAEGRGLGHKFLRHISRTRVLLHAVSAEHENPAHIYKTIRDELASFDESLSRKNEMVLLTKTDLVDNEILQARLQELREVSHTEPIPVSIVDDASVKKLSDTLSHFLSTQA